VDFDAASIIETLRALPDAVVIAILFFAAFIEYVFPPFPGDTFVVGGVTLVSVFGWHWVPVMGVVTAGAVAGTAVDFAIGRWLVRSGRIARLGDGSRATVDTIVQRMRRHGPIYLAVNRFLPGIRALFFVAAGVADLPRWQVMLWSTVSAVAWNALLVGAGFLVGNHVDDLELFLTRFTFVGWALIAVVVGYFVFKWLRSRRAARSRSRTAENDRT
jgi:membrane protein DedA with SNARE-associated domain